VNKLLTLKRIFDRILDAALVAAGALFVFLFFVILADVLSSYLWNYSLTWSIEVSEYILAFATFLGAAWLLREDGHIKFDLVLQFLSPKMKTLFDWISSLLGIFISLVITVYSVITVMEQYTKGIHTESLLKLPKAVLLAIIPVGMSLLLIQFVIRFLQRSGELFSKNQASNSQKGM
jgi:TRAP-type C4-dicarboxylate transport system permease small subunit